MASGPFQESYEAVKRVEETVNSRLAEAFANAKALRDHTISTIDGLKNPSLDIGDPGDIPTPPSLSMDFDFDFDLPEISPNSFGEIKPGAVDRPVLSPIPALEDVEVPEFKSSVGSVNMPQAPTIKDLGGLPEAPSLGKVQIPDEPDILLPDVPDILSLDLPKFSGLSIPTLDVGDADLDLTITPAPVEWDPMPYKTEVLDDVISTLRGMWSGKHGLPPGVEEAMFQRAMDRERIEVNKAVSEVNVEFSRRGFTLPSGLYASRVDAIRKEGILRANSLGREVAIQVAQWQIENLRFAVEQGVAAENVLVNIFENTANRLLEVKRLQVDAQFRLYDAKVAVYNANISKMQVKVAVFEAALRGELSKIEVFKAELEAELAKGQVNDQNIRLYEAMIRTVISSVEIYKAKMQGANIHSETIRSQIEGYKAEVQAYAESVKADKVRFDVYDTQVRAEASKMGIVDAEARAYSALIQGKLGAADVSTKRIDSVVRTNSAKIEEFRSILEMERNNIAAQMAVIDAGAKAYTADTQRFVAMAQALGEKAKLGTATKEAEVRTNVAYYQAQIQAYVNKMEMMIKQAQLALDAMRSAGQLSSTLAAGAMAGVSVGASLSGQSGVSATGSEQNSNSKSYGEQRSYNENHNYGA